MRISCTRSLHTLVIALALGSSGCLGGPSSDDENEELHAPVDLARDSHDIEPPVGYVEASYANATFPLTREDPRATYELPADTVLIDPGLFAPPPEDDVRTEKWVGNPDERTRVTDTTLSPQRMAALLIITIDGRSTGCSGVMVGRDAALTNGHCLFNPGTQRWATSAVVIPGAYPDPANPSRYRAPFGTSSGRRLFTPTNWRLGQGEVQKGHDYGIVRVNNANFVSSWRTVGYASAPSGNIESYGYHGDLTLYQMYRSRGPILGWFDQANGNMKVGLSLFQGNSGAGVSASATSSIVAVMRATSLNYNFALFFNAAKRDEIRSWINLVL
jgi:V8-like Glu-specific endopeptidase